eukprot:COSAG03_NODE_1012_length_5042_cov_173.962978_6_plen_151_part_01
MFALSLAVSVTVDAYMVGVVALYRSLRRVKALSAERPLLVMVTEEVTESAQTQLKLAAAACRDTDRETDRETGKETAACGGFIEIVTVDALGNPATEQGERAKRRFDSVYTKLNVFALGERERERERDRETERQRQRERETWGIASRTAGP